MTGCRTNGPWKLHQAVTASPSPPVHRPRTNHGLVFPSVYVA
jgi:hypothetical protein